MEFLRATYHLAARGAEAEERAQALALEQTVELPREAVSHPFVLREIVARVEELVPHSEGGTRARIAFPIVTLAGDPAQLLNVVFGNCSLLDDVRLLDLELPRSVRELLRGPRYGIDGLRKAADVPDRALTCTALKPLGLSAEELGELCETFARAGIDLIKDDHGLADHAFCRFEDRVRACQQAVERAADATGRRAVYVPNLTGPPAALEQQLELAQALGVRAILIAPMLIGLPTFWELVQGSSALPVLAHPAFGGALRIAPETLLGSIFRLLGADAVIYPHSGGRFGYGEGVCAALAERLRRDWEPLLPALPVPAGGMDVERVGELISFYGPDTMLLIGGSLYRAGGALYERTREFVESVREASSGLRE